MLVGHMPCAGGCHGGHTTWECLECNNVTFAPAVGSRRRSHRSGSYTCSAKRSMLRVVLLADDREGTADSVERLMGTKAEARFAFISDKAEFASDDLLDV